MLLDHWITRKVIVFISVFPLLFGGGGLYLSLLDWPHLKPGIIIPGILFSVIGGALLTWNRSLKIESGVLYPAWSVFFKELTSEPIPLTEFTGMWVEAASETRFGAAGDSAGGVSSLKFYRVTFKAKKGQSHDYIVSMHKTLPRPDSIVECIGFVKDLKACTGLKAGYENRVLEDLKLNNSDLYRAIKNEE